MKRVATVSGNDGDVQVRIRIEVVSRPVVLTKDEMQVAIDSLTGEAMTVLSKARYVSVPLAQQRIRRG